MHIAGNGLSVLVKTICWTPGELHLGQAYSSQRNPHQFSVVISLRTINTLLQVPETKRPHCTKWCSKCSPNTEKWNTCSFFFYFTAISIFHFITRKSSNTSQKEGEHLLIPSSHHSHIIFFSLRIWTIQSFNGLKIKTREKKFPPGR